MFKFEFYQQIPAICTYFWDGAIAQLARASRWQREGLGFESP
jgi:hypothetical protein